MLSGRSPTIHLGVDGALEAAVDWVWAACGTILGAPITIPMGRFVELTDPNGNAIGPFEGDGT